MNQSPEPRYKRTLQSGVAAVSAAAALIIVLELARTMRSFLWLGYGVGDLAPIVGGWVVYAAIIGIVCTTVWLWIPKNLRGVHVAGMLPFLSAAAVWGALGSLTRELETSGVLIGIATLLGAAFLLFVLTRKNSALILAACSSVPIAAVVGLFAAAALHRYLLFQPQVRPWAAWAAIGVTGFTWLLIILTLKLKAPIPAVLGAGLLVFGGIWSGLAHEAKASADSPNLLLVTSDTLRADFCGVYGGGVPTPNMDLLAGRGAVFDRSYSLAPWTLPSMLGLLSSSYPPSPSPDRTVAERREEVGRYRFPEDTATLAELLKAEGYATAAFVANTLLDDPDGFLRGFDTSIVVGHRTHVPTGFFEDLPLLQRALRRPFPGVVRPRPVDTTRILSTYAAAFMERQAEPWFLWVHFMDPHTAYDPPDAYRTEDGPWPVFCNADPYWGEREFDEHGLVELDPEHRAYVESLYRGEIRYIDDAVGRLMESLGRSGAVEDTYICFTSDHGEEFWEHGEFGHGQSLYNELTHVPLIFTGPGVVAQRIAEPYSAIDVVPTLADLLALPRERSWRGVSSADALRAGQPPESRPVFAQATHPSITEEPWQCVWLGDWKLMRGMVSGDVRVYNLTLDPGESMDSIESPGAPVSELLALVESWSTSFPATFSSPAAEASPDPSQTDLLQRLQDLGYL